MEASVKSQEFLKQRRNGIGGSDVAAIIGESEYGSPIDVYRQKIDGHEIATTPAMRYGTFNEGRLATEFQVATHEKINDAEVYVTHPDHKWVMGHIDRLILNDDGSIKAILEIKTVGPHTEHLWGAPGTDKIPYGYLIQVQWYLGIANALWGVTKACVWAEFRANLTCHLYEISFDPELFEAMRRMVDDFRQKYLLKNTPPPVDESEAYKKFLADAYPTAVIDEEPLHADEEQTGTMRRLFDVKAQLKELEAEEMGLKNKLMADMQEHSKMVSEHGKVTWNNVKGSLNPWSLVKEMNPPQDLIDKHTGPPTRSFRAYPKKAKKGGE